MAKTAALSRWDFLRQITEDALRLGQGIVQGYRQGCRLAETEAHMDDYPLAHTYPRELFEDEAHRLGLDIDTLGEAETVRRIILAQQEQA